MAEIQQRRNSNEAEPPRKRPRQDESQSQFPCLQSELDKAAESIRLDGHIPNTIFLPSLPLNAQEPDLRVSIGDQSNEIKIVNTGGKKMAWVTFPSEEAACQALKKLRMSQPSLKATFHRPKTTGGTCIQQQRKKRDLFQRFLNGMRGKGALGNTLLFRNLPPEVGCDEFREVLRDVVAQSQQGTHSCIPLRIRTALSRGGGRSFWAVFAGIDSCKSAFVSLHGSRASFRCGKGAVLQPVIHNDATDVDENKRRGRAAAMRAQSTSQTLKDTVCVSRRSNVDLLEDFLRQTEKSFTFLQNMK